ncbi:CAP domain-containing protein [Thermomonospora umbrina]|uniref:Uncharacterized protein YkwD n=1 Tax=Thermomonospora umbrina TaxID=111806 RepID=A0A3D9SQU6_9ACTN|nr:CAP domain-containing protein [Thermomonospora umbrina]REE98158.1 uncharacterized protein YkwD [Thermomonospora umbrina]
MPSLRPGSAGPPGPARRSAGRRAVVTTATLTCAALAIAAGVGLDRLVLPAFDDSDPGVAASAQRDRVAEDAEPGSKDGRRAGTAGPLAPGRTTAPNTRRPSEDPAPPLKRLRMPDTSPSGPSGSGDGGGSGSGSGDGGSGGGTRPPSGSSGLEGAVVRLTNDERAKAGCSALRVDQRLVTSARNHSADMAAKGYFDHTSPNGDTFADRIKRTGYPSPGAENIAMGQPTAASVMRAWMDSPGHRANILNCGLKALGVGVGVGVRTGSGGPWWTQNFGWE